MKYPQVTSKEQPRSVLGNPRDTAVIAEIRNDSLTDNGSDFAEDTLRGADAIGVFLYGKHGQRRKVYHLVASSNLGVFRLGSMICARKSVLLKAFASQEARHTAGKRDIAK
jgi:hypothetical protein